MPPEQTNPYASYVPQSSGDQNRQRKLILIAVAVVVLLIAAVLFTLIGSKSKVIVNVTSDRTSEITYRFVSQADRSKVTEVKNTAKRVEVTLPDGDYELTVTQDETNYFSVIDTDEDTTVDAKPQPEKGRRYVGNLPKSCRYFLNNRLFSYECGGTLETLTDHVPADPSQPTFTRPGTNRTEDVIEGLIKTKEGDVMVIYEAEVAGHEEAASVEGQPHSPHVAFLLKNGLDMNLENRTGLADLGEKDRYAFLPYRDGFLAYDTLYTKAFYYSSIKAKAEQKSIEKPNDAELLPYTLSAHGSLFAVAYSKEEGNNPEQSSEVVVHDEDQTRKYEFEKTFGSIYLCGDKKLCGLVDNLLEVYDVSSDDPQLLYTVGDVSGINMNDGGLIVEKDDNIVSLDVDTWSGYIQYNFGDYNSCGTQTTGDSYLVCISTPEGAEAVLYIEQQATSDDIDKKVAKLMETIDVSTVSVYGTFITITPQAGGVEYRPTTDDFGYNPEKVKQANEAITKKLNELGIDQNKYTVRRTLN